MNQIYNWSNLNKLKIVEHVRGLVDLELIQLTPHAPWA